MKYSEFKTEVEKLGCEVWDRGYNLFVKRNTYTILAVNKNKEFEFEFDLELKKWSGIGEIKGPLFDLAYQLAKTPLAEREEEKKYRVKFPNIKQSGLPIILTKVNWDGSGYTTTDCPCESYIEKHLELYTFTEQEIKDIDERYFLFAEEVKK